MKITKGDAGYIRSQKVKIFIKTVLQFGIVIAILLLGIMQTGDRLNLLTVVAILGCLPASKTLVGLIMVLPRHSVTKEVAKEVEEKANLLTRIYDLVFTSEKNIMPVDCIVISKSTVFGFTSNKKTDTDIVSNHIKQYLTINQFDKTTVKIFDNYTAFVTRAEGLNNIMAIEKADTKELEEAIRKVILNLSL